MAQPRKSNSDEELMVLTDTNAATDLTSLEREMAKSYVIVHSRLINAHLRDGHLDRALLEAQGVVAALERLEA